MGQGRRGQVIAGVAAVLLLVAAWFATKASDDSDGSDGRADGSSAAAASSTVPPPPTSSVPSSTTTSSTVPTRTLPASVRAGLVLEDVTKAAGLAQPHTAGPITGQDDFTGGVAVADVDGDGDQDVFLTRIGLPNRLLLNDGRGRFTDGTDAAGLGGTDQRNGYAAAVWADVDGDGDLDLFLTGAGKGAAALFTNDGRGHFTDRTSASGLGGLRDDGPLGTTSYGASFADWDHDGTLDLVVLQWYTDPLSAQMNNAPGSGGPPPAPTTGGIDQCQLAKARRAALAGKAGSSLSRLYRNDGTGRFTDVTASSGVDVGSIIGFQPRFADVDGDGWEDLAITGDFCTSRLYRNDRGRRFVDITDQARVGTDENGMGSVLADIDGDGNVDWFVTAITPGGDGLCPDGQTFTCTGNRLYLGDGTGRFTDGTDQLGVRDGSWGWGAAAADLNDDGRLDLVMANGHIGPGGLDRNDPNYGDLAAVTKDPSRLWLGTASGPWPEGAEQVGMDDRTDGKGLVAFDADGDGDLDLVVATTDGDPVLYRNDTPRDDRHHWLGLRLRQAGPNPFAIGARVRVTVGDGSPPRPFEVHADGSFQSSDPTDLHVGLGRRGRVAKIEIWWPGTTTPQVLTDVAADQLLAVTRP